MKRFLSVSICVLLVSGGSEDTLPFRVQSFGFAVPGLFSGVSDNKIQKRVMAANPVLEVMEPSDLNVNSYPMEGDRVRLR